MSQHLASVSGAHPNALQLSSEEPLLLVPAWWHEPTSPLLALLPSVFLGLVIPLLITEDMVGGEDQNVLKQKIKLTGLLSRCNCTVFIL